MLDLTDYSAFLTLLSAATSLDSHAGLPAPRSSLFRKTCTHELLTLLSYHAFLSGVLSLGTYIALASQLPFWVPTRTVVYFDLITHSGCARKTILRSLAVMVLL